MGMQHIRGVCSPVAALAAACLLALAASADGDTAPAELDAAAAEALVRQVWYEGFPRPRAAGLSAQGVARLAAMLADPTEREHHANILLALAASGRPGAYEAVSSWSPTAREGEIDRAGFRAWQALPHALGELARHDTRALALLEEQLAGRTPSWHFRHQRDHRLRRLAQRAAATALAHSGRPEAAALLQRAAVRAADEPDLREHLEQCQALHRDLRERAR